MTRQHHPPHAVPDADRGQERDRSPTCGRSSARQAWCGTALAAALWLAATPASAGVEVRRVISDDGSVRYTLRRVDDSERGAEESDISPAAAEPGPSETPGKAGPAEDESTGSTRAPDARGGKAREEAGVGATGSTTAGGATTGMQDIRSQIERDREVLRRIVSERSELPIDERRSPELDEIAERLPRLQSELEALEAEPSP